MERAAKNAKVDTDLINEMPQPICVFRVEQGKTAANDSALRDFNGYCDKLIALGEGFSPADNVTFINEIAQGLDVHEETRLQAVAE